MKKILDRGRQLGHSRAMDKTMDAKFDSLTAALEKEERKALKAHRALAEAKSAIEKIIKALEADDMISLYRTYKETR